MDEEKLKTLLDDLEERLFRIAGEVAMGKMYGEIKADRANHLEQAMSDSITATLRVKKELGIPSEHQLPEDRQ